MKSAVATKNASQIDYRKFGFVYGTPDSTQIENKIFTLHAQLYPTNYEGEDGIKQVATNWLANARNILKSKWAFTFGIVDVLNNLQSNITTWNNLKQFSTFIALGENRNDFDIPVTFDNITDKITELRSPKSLPIVIALSLYVLMLLSYFVTKEEHQKIIMGYYHLLKIRRRAIKPVLILSIKFNQSEHNGKNRDFYIKYVADLNVQDIVEGIRDGKVSFEELQATLKFDAKKQKQVKEQRINFEKEDSAFEAANTLLQLRDFLKQFPQSKHCEIIRDKIFQKESEEREKQKAKINQIRRNINEYTPAEVKKELGETLLRDLCDELGIDYNVVNNYDEPQLNFNNIPQNVNDVPNGYTDVIFWGIPSSGKTCALAASLRTIKDKYTMTSPSYCK